MGVKDGCVDDEGVGELQGFKIGVQGVANKNCVRIEYVEQALLDIGKRCCNGVHFLRGNTGEPGPRISIEPKSDGGRLYRVR